MPGVSLVRGPAEKVLDVRPAKQIHSLGLPVSRSLFAGVFCFSVFSRILPMVEGVCLGRRVAQIHLPLACVEHLKTSALISSWRVFTIKMTPVCLSFGKQSKYLP